MYSRNSDQKNNYQKLKCGHYSINSFYCSDCKKEMAFCQYCILPHYKYCKNPNWSKNRKSGVCCRCGQEATQTNNTCIHCLNCDVLLCKRC